jgi:hypothetical protein
MANVRSLNKDKYNISNYRFRELYYFCLQYEEWKSELNELHNPLKAVRYSAMSSSYGVGNPTENIAIERAELAHSCAVIEEAAKMADEELHNYILYAVTHENITFKFLKMQKGMPCERDRYYSSRRKFYFYLDRILRQKEIKSRRSE